MIDQSATPTNAVEQENLNSRKTRVLRSLQHLEGMTKALDAAVPNELKSSIAKVLEAMEPAIISACSRGLSNGQIADILLANGAAFRRDSIRLALGKFYPKRDPTQARISRRRVVVSFVKPKAKPSVNSMEGREVELRRDERAFASLHVV